MCNLFRPQAFCCAVVGLSVAAGGCSQRAPIPAPPPFRAPRGFTSTLLVVNQGHLYRFGPFVGYYFRQVESGDFGRVEFACFNERGFYSSDMPVNAKLFRGEGVLVTLQPSEEAMPEGTGRIRPIFFEDAPPAWTASRPEPQDEFVHFHSMYDATGPALLGYWLRHRAVAAFTYDMGGRVDGTSPLWHHPTPGPDREFPRIIEFDFGHRRQSP